jgi:hypothetical protein
MKRPAAPPQHGGARVLAGCRAREYFVHIGGADRAGHGAQTSGESSLLHRISEGNVFRIALLEPAIDGTGVMRPRRPSGLRSPRGQDQRKRCHALARIAYANTTNQNE